MRNYIAVQGDTFSIIARKEYGDDKQVNRIIQSNPGVNEPLTPGISIKIPDNPDAPQIISQAVPSDSQNEVSLKIENNIFRFWETITITRSIDTFDTIEFTAPHEVNNKAFRDTFRPFSYKTAEVTVDGLPFFKGTMININPVVDPKRKVVAVNGYSLPGVLNDCTLPSSALPFEYSGQNLNEIAKTIAGYFGLGVEFTSDGGEDFGGSVFDNVAVDTTKKAFGFLIELSKQRNFVISSTSTGKLLFQKSIDAGDPVARFVQGDSPLFTITSEFKPQEYYSDITGQTPAVVGIGGENITVKNERLKGVLRPLIFKAKDTNAGTLQEAVKAKMSRMFANAASYNIKISTWRDPQGNLWKPNTTITLIAPGVMVYLEYEFLIRNVKFMRGKNSESVVLNIVIPESFNGRMPERLPWDE